MLSVGSCFSENIGKRFSQAKFDMMINPFGQQYNPVSIANGLIRIVNGDKYEFPDLIEHNELFHSFDHHGSFSLSDAEETLSNINVALERAHQWIKQARIIWITPGTAHVFVHKNQRRIVNNCHKIPASNFERLILTGGEIYNHLRAAIEKIRLINNSCKIIFTVSPVRYFALGHFENSVSKGRLFDAIYLLTKEVRDVFYFPSYELVIDELRDYRFYKTDMLHPSDEAIDFVWSKLRYWMSADCMVTLDEAESINSILEHKIMTNNTSEIHRHYHHVLQRMMHAQLKFGIDYTTEIADIKKRAGLIPGSH